MKKLSGLSELNQHLHVLDDVPLNRLPYPDIQAEKGATETARKHEKDKNHK